MGLIHSPPSPSGHWTGIRSSNGAHSPPSLTQGSVNKNQEQETELTQSPSLLTLGSVNTDREQERG